MHNKHKKNHHGMQITEVHIHHSSAYRFTGMGLVLVNKKLLPLVCKMAFEVKSFLFEL